MAIIPMSGHQLEVGDKVKINIPVVEDSDLDGVEFTTNGINYWRYIKEHPEEVYTVTHLDFNYPDAPYCLSGPMEGSSWSADELIHQPEPQSRFEIIKNMTIEEMSTELIPMIQTLCEDGVPCPKFIQVWLKAKPSEE